MATGKHSVSSRKSPSKTPQTKKNSPVGLIAVVVVLVLLIIAGVKLYGHFFGEEAVEVAMGEEITVKVEEGTTSAQIASLLKENRLISTATEFNDLVEDRGVAAEMKAGTYVITGGTSVDSIVDMLIEGPSNTALLVQEGFTAKQISTVVQEVCGINADEFYQLTLSASKYASEYPFLKGVYNDSMEGFLFPDTYSVAPDDTADSIIRKMLDNFQTQIAQVDMSYASEKNLTEYDIVTLASIVEKESGGPDDKAGISRVFYNRLHEGMNLGSDVTCYYGVGKELTEELTVSDLNSDNPYNTRNANKKGLPAGPICNPGLAALTAAAQPADGDALYFFWSAKKSKTMFFDNHEDFTAAWAKYGE